MQVPGRGSALQGIFAAQEGREPDVSGEDEGRRHEGVRREGEAEMLCGYVGRRSGAVQECGGCEGCDQTLQEREEHYR